MKHERPASTHNRFSLRQKLGALGVAGIAIAGGFAANQLSNNHDETPVESRDAKTTVTTVGETPSTTIEVPTTLGTTPPTTEVVYDGARPDGSYTPPPTTEDPSTTTTTPPTTEVVYDGVGPNGEYTPPPVAEDPSTTTTTVAP